MDRLAHGAGNNVSANQKATLLPSYNNVQEHRSSQHAVVRDPRSGALHTALLVMKTDEDVEAFLRDPYVVHHLMCGKSDKFNSIVLTAMTSRGALTNTVSMNESAMASLNAAAEQHKLNKERMHYIETKIPEDGTKFEHKVDRRVRPVPGTFDEELLLSVPFTVNLTFGIPKGVTLLNSVDDYGRHVWWIRYGSLYFYDPEGQLREVPANERELWTSSLSDFKHPSCYWPKLQSFDMQITTRCCKDGVSVSYVP